jgi:hypothetical protein
LHAGVAIAANRREQLERLCRYVSRSPVASERLALAASGQVRYALKTPYRDGTTHIVLEPLDLIAEPRAGVSFSVRAYWFAGLRGPGTSEEIHGQRDQCGGTIGGI